ncbi:hypothetical protein ACLOJK_015476 [Asimina triloba]
MRSLSPSSGSRKSDSVCEGSTARPDASPVSDYSDASSRQKAPAGRNPVRRAARALGACFAPSEVRSSTSDTDLDFSQAPSATSDSSSNRRHSRNSYSSSYNSTQSEAGGMKFTLEEIYRATRNFSPSFKIGQGGFGTVYKGRLANGTYVAVKRAKKSVYDKHLSVEFQSEIQTLARVEHLNLVRFFGYLEYNDERIVLMEYVSNGSLREHLDYHPIIHRDVKSSNILLTENLRAKVADFGFARLGSTDEGVTHVSTQVKGTAGYLDPEYLRTYQLTEKSDVYSFGVLLVELMTGRRPIEPKKELKERITARWAMKKFTEGNAIQTLDPRLKRSAVANLALEKIYELALQCLAPTRQSRPSMRTCAEILWSIRKDYRELAASGIHSQSSFQMSAGEFFSSTAATIKSLNFFKVIIAVRCFSHKWGWLYASFCVDPDELICYANGLLLPMPMLETGNENVSHCNGAEGSGQKNIAQADRGLVCHVLLSCVICHHLMRNALCVSRVSNNHPYDYMVSENDPADPLNGSDLCLAFENSITKTPYINNLGGKQLMMTMTTSIMIKNINTKYFM